MESPRSPGPGQRSPDSDKSMHTQAHSSGPCLLHAKHRISSRSWSPQCRRRLSRSAALFHTTFKPSARPRSNPQGPCRTLGTSGVSHRRSTNPSRSRQTSGCAASSGGGHQTPRKGHDVGRSASALARTKYPKPQTVPMAQWRISRRVLRN